MSGCADTTLSMNAEAWAVLHLLAAKSPDFAEFKNGKYKIDIMTTAWYGQRERGFCLKMHPELAAFGRNVLHVCCARHRNNDDLTIWYWMSSKTDRAEPVYELPDHARNIVVKTVQDAVNSIYGILSRDYAAISELETL